MVSIGESVTVRGNVGIVKFTGPTQFAPGTWIGIELNVPGKNNGSVNGVKYFECDKKDDNYGIFIRPSLLETQNPISDKLELNSLENSHLHRLIDKLQLKLKSTTSDIKSYKTQIDDLKSQISSSTSTQEFITIEKESLSRENEQLKENLIILQQKYDDLQKHHTSLQEELEVNRQIEQEIKNQEPSSVSPEDFALVVAKSTKLEQSVAQLKKLNIEGQLSFEAELKAIKDELLLKEEKVQNYDTISSQLDAAQITINLLQLQLDSTMDSEKIIEHLTTENQQLVDQVSKLNKAVNELNELHELDQSLDESRTQIEENLKSDIRALQKTILDDKMIMSDLERKNRYLESKFLEYRERPSHGDRNSSMTLSPELNDEEIVIKNLNLEIESIKIELRKQKAMSFADNLSLKLAQTKLDLLGQFDISTIPNNVNLRNGYQVLFDINLSVAYVSIILDTIELITSTDVQYQLLNLVTVRAHFRYLFSFLQSVAHLWQYNYATKHYLSIMPSFKTILSELQDNIMLTCNHLKEWDIDNIPVSGYVSSFITESIDLLRLSFVTDTYSIIFMNISLFKIITSILHHESKENMCLLKYMIRCLDRHFQNTSEPEDLVRELYEKVSLLFENACTISEVSEVSLKKLDDACLSSKDIAIEVDKTPTLDELNASFDNLLKIVKKIELEEYSINHETEFNLETLKDIFEFDDDVESWNTLDSIQLSFEFSEEFLKAPYETYAKQAQSIYDSINDKSIHSAVPVEKQEMKRYSTDSTYSDLNTKLAEKEHRIQDLQLNVRLLEKNMASSDAKSREYVDKLKQELINSEKEHEVMKESYNSVVKANKELESEIQELLKSNQVFESSQLVGKFNDLKSQKKFTEEMALVEEVLLLRKMVALKYNQSTENEQLQWLNEPIKTASKTNGLADPPSQIIKPQQVQVAKRTGAWRPRTNIPKYVNTLIEEKKRHSQHERGSSFSN